MRRQILVCTLQHTATHCNTLQHNASVICRLTCVRNSGEALIREAVAAAMKQDARAESGHPALVDRLAERKIEMTGIDLRKCQFTTQFTVYNESRLTFENGHQRFGLL